MLYFFGLLAAFFAQGYAQAPPLPAQSNLTSSCGEGFYPTYNVANYSIENGSLREVWNYFSAWNNKSWTSNEYVTWVSGPGMEPGTLRNTTFGSPDSTPRTQQIVFRLGSDENNVPFAPYVQLGFRNAYNTVGNETFYDDLQIWWATQLVHSTPTDPALDVTDGVVIGFSLYSCSDLNPNTTSPILSQEMDFLNVYNYFAGNGVNNQTANYTVLPDPPLSSGASPITAYATATAVPTTAATAQSSSSASSVSASATARKRLQF